MHTSVTKHYSLSKSRIFICISLFLLLIASCSGPDKEMTDAVDDRSKTPRMHTENVTTLVSDSGITRYRISAPIWDLYDRANEPYWEFPKGIHFERFDLDLKVDANIHSNYARFNENKQLWELKGNVKATNIEGSLFETELLFWDQRGQRVYSDSLITITEKSGFVHVGQYGFDANQTLTKYVIKNTSGIIPVNE